MLSNSAELPPSFSEEALALQLIEKYGPSLRYVAPWKSWMVWNGTHWQADDSLRVMNLSRSICRSAAASLETMDKSPHAARRIASKHTVTAIEMLCRADRRIAASIEQWDADPWLLNTPSGTVNLKTGEVQKHSSQNYMTKITAVTPEGECPLWLKFLDTITNGDKELQSYLQRKAGYALTGSTREQDIDFIYGTGRNGKGVFINTLTHICGSYAKVATMDTFTASNTDKHPTDMAMLRGARLVTAQETEDGRRWAESKIKAMTGGDPITARFMRQDFFTYVPQFKLLIAGNHKPSLRNVDEAIRRRFHLVPFLVTIPVEEQDKDLPEKLKLEWAGILKWAVRGAVEWQESGLQPPAAVLDATGDYFASEDTLDLWFQEKCELASNGTATATELFGSWSAWCQTAGEYIGSQKSFSQKVRAKFPNLSDWRCPSTRRKGLQGIQVIYEAAKSWHDTSE